MRRNQLTSRRALRTGQVLVFVKQYSHLDVKENIYY